MASEVIEDDDGDNTGLLETGTVAPVAPKPFEPKRVHIIIDDNSEIPPTGLFVQVNGRNFIIKTGVVVAVPTVVINVLDDAVQAMPILDPHTQRFISTRNRLRFPYRVVSSNRQIGEAA